jgi:tripartite-type tricarboxylate transporter receptor subunit TctC
MRLFHHVYCSIVAALALGIAPIDGACAQTFPTKPLRLVVPFAPGGSSDVVARLVADGAREALGQPIIIENVPGAGGNIGMARVAKATPDGYTITECTIGTCAINPSIYANTGYDLQKDFEPVFLVGGVMNVFTVHPSLNVKTIPELVAYVKANPGKLPAAIGAVGSSNHLTPVWFASLAGLDMLYVPFKGSGDSITALLSGQVMFFVDNEPSILPQINAGKARALSVTGPRRSTFLPNVPTMEELGYKGFVVEPWYGFMVPRGTPRAVIAKLNSAFNAAIQNPRIKARLEEAGLRLVGAGPERLRDQIATEYPRWAKVVKANNIKAE